jgi:hypothetical protein
MSSCSIHWILVFLDFQQSAKSGRESHEIPPWSENCPHFAYRLERLIVFVRDGQISASLCPLLRRVPEDSRLKLVLDRCDDSQIGGRVPAASLHADISPISVPWTVSRDYSWARYVSMRSQKAKFSIIPFSFL